MNTFDLSRSWFNFAFENPELVKPIHSAIFFFAIEHCNRLGNKEKFGFPSQMTMDAIGVKKFQTYGKALNELSDWGFIHFIERSKNQYSANIISISATPKKGIARGTALDKATIKHGSKHSQSTGQGMDSIDKPINQETKKPIEERKVEFKNELSTHYQNGLIDKIDANEFYAYWTEHGKNDRKMRFEKEKSYSMERRISTWLKNKKNFEKEKSSGKKEKLNVTQRVLKGDYAEVTEMILNATSNPQYKKISGE